VGEDVPRQEDFRRRQARVRSFNSDRVDDRCGEIPVIQQRAVGREAILAHELLGIERAVLLAELHVAFSRNLAHGTVVRHL
jgi:hypothetical protein